MGLLDKSTEPEVGDYAVIKLVPVNSTKARHCVANIVDKSEDDVYEVHFFRESSKMSVKFVKPAKEDVDGL